MINFSNGILERGIAVDVLVGRSEGPFRFLLSDEANVIELGRGMLRSIPKIRKHLKTSAADIVFSSQLNVNIAAVLSGRFLGRGPKVVLREATTPSQMYERATPGSNKRRFMSLAKKLFKKADHVIAVSDDSREDSINFYRLNPSNVTTVFAPFITSAFCEQADQEVDHPWFVEDLKVVASLGRVMPVKDFGTLIKAFALAREEEGNARLLIIGNTDRDPAYYSELNTLVERLSLGQFVDFIGFKSNPFPYLLRSHIYVLSSLFEGLPGSLVQGLALGCHIVSTDCESGPREILQNGDLGSLVPVGDEKAMGEAILAALRTKRVEGKTLDKVSEFSEQRSMEKLIAIFESLES